MRQMLLTRSCLCYESRLPLFILSPFFSRSLCARNQYFGLHFCCSVMDVLAEEYNKTHPDNYIAVQGIGSTAGITMVNKGVADVGMSSRYLTNREQSEELQVFPIAFDGLAVVTNRSNAVNNITREQLFDIYKGKVTNWKEVGGADQPIAVVTREASSGSRYSFSLLGLTKIINDRRVSDINPNNLVVNSNSMVKQSLIITHTLLALSLLALSIVRLRQSHLKALSRHQRILLTTAMN